MKRSFFIGVFLVLIISYSYGRKPDVNYIEAATKLADAEIKRNESVFYYPADGIVWNYELSFLSEALIELFATTNDSTYYNCVKTLADYFCNADGEIKTYDQSAWNLKNLNGGTFLYDVYWHNRSGVKYLRGMHTLRQQFYKQPRTKDRVFQSTVRQPGLVCIEGFMAFPFYTLYGAVLNEDAVFNDVAIQLVAADKQTINSATGLNYHAWSESRQSHSSVVFSQSLGWYMMSIVDALEYFPVNHDQRVQLIEILNRLTTALTKYQDKKTGMWYQVTDQPKKAGNFRETSSSAMFAYAIAKGVNNGYLPAKYRKTAEKAFQGLQQYISTEGTVLMKSTRAADLTPDNDSYNYYVGLPLEDNSQVGIAAFVLAATELEKTQK